MGYCWKTAKGVAARKLSCLAVRQLLTAPNAPGYALDSFLATTPFEDIIRTLIHNVFLNPAVTQESASTQLAVDLITADCFVNIGQKDASRFVDEAKIHGHVAAVVRARAQAIDDEDQRWAILDACAPFLKYVSPLHCILYNENNVASEYSNTLNASTNTAEAFKDLINGYGFLELAADAMVTAAPRTDSFGCEFFRFLIIITHLFSYYIII